MFKVNVLLRVDLQHEYDATYYSMRQLTLHMRSTLFSNAANNFGTPFQPVIFISNTSVWTITKN